MEPGDVLFHALSTPHGSRVNTSDSMRRVFYVHYLAEDVYQDGYSAEPWASEKPGWSILRQNQIRFFLALPLDLDVIEVWMHGEGGI